MKKTLLIALFSAILLSACGSSGPVHSAKDAESAILAAEFETGKAKKKNYAWRDTGKLIKKAKEAVKAGNFDEAVKLAGKAKRQSSNALAQYEENLNSKPRF